MADVTELYLYHTLSLRFVIPLEALMIAPSGVPNSGDGMGPSPIVGNLFHISDDAFVGLILNKKKRASSIKLSKCNNKINLTLTV
jgi:hypothetical protein